MVVLGKLDEPAVRDWYVRQSLTGGWSRNVMLNQIKGRAHARAGAAPSNFELTLPGEDSGPDQGAAEFCFLSYPVSRYEKSGSGGNTAPLATAASRWRHASYGPEVLAWRVRSASRRPDKRALGIRGLNGWGHSELGQAADVGSGWHAHAGDDKRGGIEDGPRAICRFWVAPQNRFL